MYSKEALPVLRALGNEIVQLVRGIMSSGYGVNGRVNINTLKDSDLYRSVRSETDSDNLVISIYMNNYVRFIESGRRPFTKKVPIDALRNWAIDRGLPTDNSFLFATQTIIYQDGIKPRPIISETFDEIRRALSGKIKYSISEIIKDQLSDGIQE